MTHAVPGRFAWVFVLALGMCAQAQGPGSRAPGDSVDAGDSQPAADNPASEAGKKTETARATEKGLLERIFNTLSQEEDPDGPINTDRPTFTPANTVVPLGRLQFESGFTFNNNPAGGSRTTLYDLPELAMRYGLFKRVEFRTFWQGQTWTQMQARPGGPWLKSGGLSDMEVGFKWQVLTEDKDRKWVPTTALITSVFAPTGGTSRLSSQTVEPYINLIYAWSLTKKLTFGGSTGYLHQRVQPFVPGAGLHTDSFERFHQSLVAFYSVGERTTLFYEWYVLIFTSAADNRPTHFMDGGVLYRLTPNMQLDLRAGFGLSGHPDDFFSGAGYSVRF